MDTKGHPPIQGSGADREISPNEMILGMSEVIQSMEGELLQARQALAFWTTMCSVMLVKLGATSPEKQIVVGPTDINGVDGSELGYTNNNRGPKTRHNFYIRLAGTGQRVTGEELRDAGKNQSTGGPRIVDLNGKPLTGK